MIVQSIITPLRILAASTNQPFRLDISDPAPAPADFNAIKAAQKAMWSSGDYARIGVTMQITGEELAEAANPRPGAQVLDIASGSGNATLAFARRCCRVTSTDNIYAMLEAGRLRTRADRLEVNFQPADAEDLPFPDASFDVVVSTFGAMYAPDQPKSASELKRVCRTGGSIAMTNWTRNGFIGTLFDVLNQHSALPFGAESPTRWGDQSWINQQFSPVAESIEFRLKRFYFRYPSPIQFLEFFRTFYGPVKTAFEGLDDEGKTQLEKEVLSTIDQFNMAMDGTMIVPSEYAQIVIRKAG